MKCCRITNHGVKYQKENVRGADKMFVLQISDLHISENTDCGKIREKIDQLEERLRVLVPSESKLACCLLGDFIDQGKSSVFPKVKELLKHLKATLMRIVEEAHLSFFLIPGNHDLCDDAASGKKTLEAFDKFATDFLPDDVSFTSGNSIYERDCFGYHFISISTILNGEHHFGAIDFSLLGQCSFPEKTIVLTHHALVSGDSTDTASIRNGYELQRILEEKEVVALLHGHTHGCKRYTVGSDCHVIGVGPMFKTVTDISNQCNLIQINGSRVHQISALTYQDDRKVWDVNVIYERNQDNNYFSRSVYSLYNKLLCDAQDDPLLPNLRIQFKQKFTEFESEITDKFSSCMEDACVWQGTDCPKTLAYTHGQLMNMGETKWDQYVIDTLRKNPTSKRAIVPLIDKKMAYKGGDEELVSFDVVQFGFANAASTELYVTVYLRALEIRHFLPINLCEIYLMAKKIQNEIQYIDSISVCFFAFRAEAKKNYGCYKKAKIDLLNESEICKLVTKRENGELKALLLEKAGMGDTVIDEAWLNRVRNAVTNFYEDANKTDIIQRIEATHTALLHLKEVRQRCSDYTTTQPVEDEFTQTLQNLAEYL